MSFSRLIALKETLQARGDNKHFEAVIEEAEEEEDAKHLDEVHEAAEPYLSDEGLLSRDRRRFV